MRVYAGPRLELHVATCTQVGTVSFTLAGEAVLSILQKRKHSADKWAVIGLVRK